MFNFFKKKTEPPKQDTHLKETQQEIKCTINKPKTYFEKSLEAANAGKIIPATHVGVSYACGIEVGDNEHPQGLEPNAELALKYLTMAANKGYLEAQKYLGLVYLYDDSSVADINKALEWITLTAKKGDAYSQYIIGICYNAGKHLPKDDVKAYHWLLESAYNGCESAMFKLGIIYQNKANELLKHKNITDEQRYEAKENASLAIKWFEKAAELGEEEAFFYTGICYFAGFGVDKNEEKSLYYINLAIDSGDDVALNFKNEYFA